MFHSFERLVPFVIFEQSLLFSGDKQVALAVLGKSVHNAACKGFSRGITVLFEVFLEHPGPIHSAVLGAHPETSAPVGEYAGDISSPKTEFVVPVFADSYGSGSEQVISPNSTCGRKPYPASPVEMGINEYRTLRKLEQMPDLRFGRVKFANAVFGADHIDMAVRPFEHSLDFISPVTFEPRIVLEVLQTGLAAVQVHVIPRNPYSAFPAEEHSPAS